ncbi:MAG: T9SS type A sorting domain-containing protein [Ignavibacteriales bacterium]|nr:T9SS type A sorting domain-containing protein [Ignavibacteriales bacterium]
MQYKHIKPFLFTLVMLSISCFAQTWEKVNMSFTGNDSIFYYARINFVTKNVGWISTIGYYDFDQYRSILLETNNGGENWKLEQSLNKSITTESTYCFNTSNVWFLGLSGDLLFTSNMGLTWDTSNIFVENYYIPGYEFGALNFFDEKNGIAFNKYRWYTTDGGYNWIKSIDTTTIFPMPTDVYFIDNKLGWIVSMLNPFVTDGGSVGNTTNGGKTWAYQLSKTNILYGVYFIDSLKGFAVGTNVIMTGGCIKSTKDGGKSWSDTTYEGVGPFRKIKFLDSLNGWMCGTGKIYRTADGGETWELQLDGLRTNLEQLIILKKEKVAYAFGKDWNDKTHTLLRADLSNLTNIEKEREYKPKNYLLLENYPNPFNPTTTISYNLPEEGRITIKIFDILGREVRTLVNDFKNTGSYSAVWDSKDNYNNEVSSGIYFYNIKFKDNSITKKMILVR